MDNDINKSVGLKYLGVGRQNRVPALVIALTVLLDCGLYYPLLDLRGGGFVGVVPFLSRSEIEIP